MKLILRPRYCTDTLYTGTNCQYHMCDWLRTYDNGKSMVSEAIYMYLIVQPILTAN